MRGMLAGTAALAMAICFASPASAAIIITADQSASTSENVQFNDGLPTNVNPMTALTNMGTSVTFTGHENLDVAGGNGQNGGVSGHDGNINYLTINLTDPTKAMSAAQFNIFEVSDVATTVTIKAYDQFGALAATLLNYQLSLAGGNNGEDWFSVKTSGGSLISKVEISTNPDVAKIAQFRLTGANNPAAVPEPATWAMMIAGFGLVGASLRLRRHERKALAA